MDLVPTYTLYGENDDNIGQEWLHCESIAARSALFDWQIRPHRHHHFFQLLYVTRGSAEALIEGRTVAPPVPFVIIMPPRAVHGFRFGKDVEGHVVTLLVDRVERMLDGCPAARDMFHRPHVIDLAGQRAAAAIDRHIAVVAAEFAGSDVWRLPLIEAHLTAALIRIARLISVAADQLGFSPLNRRALDFRMLVDRNYRRRLPVAYYAAQLGTSQTHLNRVCRAAFDESALRVIDRRVALEATRDLTFTLMSVKEIAASLGFDDPAYFTRFFTKRIGMSPTRFRRRQGRAVAGRTRK